ncbi:MAG: DUF5686 and carboxypeptidase regulatory-like domain-containing protein [Bacteroidia bacterium]|nr:DUF5686 and carboxypeptidase regulatory-like domain-containing protein [Bacteroidia bacterium]
MPRSWIVVFPLIAFSQIQVVGTVKDTDGEPIPFAVIQNLATAQGTLSDLQGRFLLRAEPEDTLEVRCVGYESVRIPVRNLPPVLILKSKPVELSPIVILPGAHPAHTLIRRLLEAKNRWDPLKHPHRYISYNKLTISLPDSLQQKNDSIPPYLFIWETETEKIYQKNGVEQEKVLSQRVIGNLPVQSFLSPTAFQPLSLYKAWLSLLDKRIASPVGSAALDYYEYEVTDTTYAGSDTLYRLTFSPKKGTEKWGMRGYLMMVMPDAALHSFQGILNWEPQGGGISRVISFQIQQQYEKVGDTLWFPTQLHSIVGLQTRAGDTYLPFLVRTRSFLWDIHIPPPLPKEAKRSELLLSQNLPSLQPERRKEPLHPEEVFSYQYLDSLLDKAPVRRLSWLLDLPSLLSGRLPMGRFNLLLRPLLLYQEAEGIRPQLGIETNDRIAQNVRLRVWGGYGTYLWAGAQGTPWRYGAEVEVGKLTLLRAFLYDDVREKTLPRLLDETPAVLLGEQSVYERAARAYSLRWEDLTREKAWGISFRAPFLSQFYSYVTMAQTQRIALPTRWEGFSVSMGIEYLRQSFLLRRGSTVWRTDYQGPRIRIQGGALLDRGTLTHPPFWLQIDLWHRWYWGRWARMELRFSAGAQSDSTPLLWQYRLRTLPTGYLGLPYALAAHPGRSSQTQFAYLFYEWNIPNTRFPTSRWSPTLSFHLQGAWTSTAIYPEAGISLQNWLPPNLTRFLSGLSMTRIAFYIPISDCLLSTKVVFIRLVTSVF